MLKIMMFAAIIITTLWLGACHTTLPAAGQITISPPLTTHGSCQCAQKKQSPLSDKQSLNQWISLK